MQQPKGGSGFATLSEHNVEWIVMALPSKPDKLRYGAYDRDGNPTTQTEKERKQAYAVHALSDPEDNPIKSPTIFSIQGGSAW